MRPRVAILTHSTNPRGAVVHAMQLAEALCDTGFEATLIAPNTGERGFFREMACPSLTIPTRSERDVAALVASRIPEIAAFLTSRATPRFDVLHAQDSITANALALLVRQGAIDGFVRTIHHLDTFADPRLMAWQAAGMHSAASVCCVSACWRDRLWEEHGLRATLVGNGCDTGRFQPGQSAPARGGPLILALGGVEPRKNTLGILRGFKLLLESFPDARLMIAGGATLLDHSNYRIAFDAELGSWSSPQSVTLAGVIDDAAMPALYRQADVLASPSLAEGFGLCALEALACGTPVVVSAIPPFTEHFESDDVLWAEPHDPASIAAALTAALCPGIAEIARTRGPAIARRFGWAAVADAHRAVYDRLFNREFAHA